MFNNNKSSLPLAELVYPRRRGYFMYKRLFMEIFKKVRVNRNVLRTLILGAPNLPHKCFTNSLNQLATLWSWSTFILKLCIVVCLQRPLDRFTALKVILEAS